METEDGRSSTSDDEQDREEPMSPSKLRANGSKRTVATKARSGSRRDVEVGAVALRRQYMLTQAQFAVALSMSIRSLATLEAGAAPTPAVARRISELRRLRLALAEVVDADVIGAWMVRPNAAFDGLKPLEVIERGEVDRIWAMIHELRSGGAS